MVLTLGRCQWNFLVASGFALLAVRRHFVHILAALADAPMEEAVALMARQRLTGEAPPKSARQIVDLWRDMIEDKAGADLDKLAAGLDDQMRYAEAVRDILFSLDMADELGPQSDSDEDDDGDEQAPEHNDPARGESGDDILELGAVEFVFQHGGKV